MMRTLVWCCALLAAAIARAGDSGLPDCGKNHFILVDPVACWQDVAKLHVARAGHTATLLLDGRVLVAGGNGDAGTSAEIYDPSTGRWTLAAALHHSREMHTATRLADGRVLVLGGYVTYVPEARAVFIGDTGEIYDPAADTWTSVAGPATPRDAFSATLLADGRVLVAGGLDDSDNALDSCEIYDPATGKWAQTGSLPDRPVPGWTGIYRYRWGHTATLLADGRVLLAGGYADDMWMVQVPGADLYDPKTGLWTAAGRLNSARASHTASLLADGRVMVTGGEWRGCCSVGTLATSEVYDPLTNMWSAGPELGTARQGHTATLLPDGSLLVAGGSQETGPLRDRAIVLLDSMEASPASAMPWAAGASLHTGRYGHTATLLGDGSVLVVGGSDVSFSPLDTAEIYRSPRHSAP